MKNTKSRNRRENFLFLLQLARSNELFLAGCSVVSVATVLFKTGFVVVAVAVAANDGINRPLSDKPSPSLSYLPASNRQSEKEKKTSLNRRENAALYSTFYSAQWEG